MTGFMPMAPFLGVWIVLILAQPGIGEESPSKSRTKNRYAELISQLASPNKAPTTKNGADSSIKFQLDYDVKAQQRIQAARQALYDDIENALPYLAQAFDDKRYCMTINWADGDAYYNESVGDICRDVVASRLEIYRDEIGFNDAAQWNRYNFPITKEWLEKRKGRSLAELQVEAIQWAIDRSRNESREWHRLSDEEIAALQKLRAAIAKSGKPAKPQRLRMLRMVTRDQ